jgi:hypothetical protein
MNKWNIQHDSPITAIKLFTLFTEIECPSFVAQGSNPFSKKKQLFFFSNCSDILPQIILRKTQNYW